MYIKFKHGRHEHVIEVWEYEHRTVQVLSGDVDIAELELQDAEKVEFFGSWGESPNNEVSAVVVTFPVEGDDTEDDSFRAIIATGCGIYVMGNDGQTIDTIRH